MNNQYLPTRVEAELSQWRSREERLNKLFSFPLASNRALLKEKLSYYERVALKYRDTPNVDERFALIMLREECRQLEKQLYPHRLTRLLRKVLIAPVRRGKVIRQDIRRIAENSQALHHQVQRYGFPDLSAKIDRQIRQRQQQFLIPVSYYLNDKERLDHQLSFARDQAGGYYFEGYKATLYNETKPDENRRQYFSMSHEHQINATEAYNLLSGRSVQKDGIWLQLDFNDNDSNGNYRFKQFHLDYKYDLDEVLKRLPLKELINKEDKDRMMKELKNGERISVSFVKEGKEQRFYIEANPQFKSVDIYDDHSRKITLHAALGNKTLKAMKVTHKVNEQQQRAQKNSMRIR